jgi:hypothetical protein
LFKAIDNKKKSVIIEGKTKPPVWTQAVLGSKKKRCSKIKSKNSDLLWQVDLYL